MNAPECQKGLQLSLALCSTSFRVLSPTRRSVGTGRREPWKRGCSLLTFATDFTCHSFENLSKFSQSDYPRAYMEFCQNLNSLKEKKKLLSQCLLGLQAGTPLVIVFKESPVLVYFLTPSAAWMGLHFHDWGDYNGILFFI